MRFVIFTNSVSEYFKLVVFFLVENVVLSRVSKVLVFTELLLHHALEDAVVREHPLQFKKLLANFPLVLGLRKLVKPSLVGLSFFLLFLFSFILVLLVVFTLVFLK